MKQYLLTCDEMGKNIITHMFKDQTIQFLEVEGMNMNPPSHQLIVTPVVPPLAAVTQTPPEQATEVVND